MAQNRVSPCHCSAVLTKPRGAAAEGPRTALLGFPWLFKSSWRQVSLEAAESSTGRAWAHVPKAKAGQRMVDDGQSCSPCLSFMRTRPLQQRLSKTPVTMGHYQIQGQRMVKTGWCFQPGIPSVCSCAVPLPLVSANRGQAKSARGQSPGLGC